MTIHNDRCANCDFPPLLVAALAASANAEAAVTGLASASVDAESAIDPTPIQRARGRAAVAQIVAGLAAVQHHIELLRKEYETAAKGER